MIQSSSEIKRKLFSGIGYRFLATGIANVFSIARMLVVVRLFSPADLGVTGLAWSYMSIMMRFVNFGFRESYIRSVEDSEDVYNASFTLSLMLGLLLCVVGYTISYLVGYFSGDFEVAHSMRTLSFMPLIFCAQIPTARLEKELNFTKAFIPEIMNSFGMFIAPIIAVYVLDLSGVDGLLSSYIVGFILSTITALLITSRMPRILVDPELFRRFLKFGVPFSLNGLLGHIIMTGDNMIVGNICSTETLGYYRVAKTLPQTCVGLVSHLENMMLPVFASAVKIKDRFRTVWEGTCHLWTTCVSPIFLFVVILAPVLVNVLYGSEWTLTIPALRWIALAYALQFAFASGHGNVAITKGRMPYLMKWSIVQAILLVIVGSYLAHILGLAGAGLVWFVQALIWIVPVRLPLIKSEIGNLACLRISVTPFVCALVSAILIFPVPYVITDDCYALVIGAVTYIGLYFILVMTFDKRSNLLFKDIRSYILPASLYQQKRSYGD